MKDYKQKTEEFIEDLNRIISDDIMFPNYNGGKFKCEFFEDNSLVAFALSFEEGANRLHYIVKKSTTEDLTFYERCFLDTQRHLFFSVDSIGSLKDIQTGITINNLSLNTIAKEGLKKYVEWKENLTSNK